jgi:uncharacterized phiE125 gp8 family phage protein
MQLNLIEGPTCEIITLEETKNYLRIDHDFDDNLISLFIKSTREAMEAIIQKSIMKQVWEYKSEDQFISNFYFNSDDYPSVFKNTLKIILPKPPVRNILCVKINDNEIDPQQCSLDTAGNKFCLCIHGKHSFTKKPKISVIVRYEAGISDCAENIPYQLKLANLMLVANAFRERYSYSQCDVISEGIRQLLSPFLNIRML